MIKKILAFIFIFWIFNTPLYPADTSGSSKVKKLDNYKYGEKKVIKGKKLEKKGKIKKANKLYKEALEYFLKANKENQIDPDTLNYLGFTNRKLGNLKDAEIYYLLGLDIDPKHEGINEYLGQLYVETNRIDKAKIQLKVLEGCGCKEYVDLESSIKKGSSKY
jgi:tetratricopeptide (TPR) repeat protein